MIVITGGAGMIGSMLAWYLNERCSRDDVVLVDHIHHPEQWQNLCHRCYADYLDRDELFSWLEGASSRVQAIVHMGAISATTERDFNLLVQNNIRYSQRLWSWCAEWGVPFLFASSAATYGDGVQGYIDTHEINSFRPLNGYGYSKQFFDQWVLRQVRGAEKAPPFWYGFKFFNVYGPNEYHKDRMASVVFHTFMQTRATGTMKLFKSYCADYRDGMQMRDFIYVKDAVDVLGHFLDRTAPSGLYNVGTGQARAFSDLVRTTQINMGLDPAIDFIEMPGDLQGKYQYFTEASMAKLRAAGYKQAFCGLEEGIRDYVQNYLMQSDPYC